MTLNGVDVASYQANLNAGTVDAEFVICKATQGTWYVNPVCDKHYQQAKAAGKLLGVYHYAEGGDPKAEADYFLANIKGYIKEAILCLDWEPGDNARWGKNDSEWVKTWCDYVYSKTGVRPIVYIQASAISRLAGIGDYGLWIAQYASNDVTGYQAHPWNEGAYGCVIRQYTSHGRLAGYAGNLDLDIAYMDAAAWKKYANPNGTAAAAAKPAAKPASQPAHQPVAAPAASGFAVGDTVKPIQLVDYNGNRLASYHNSYTVSEIHGDRAVLTVGGQVWAALRTSNLSKVGGGSAPAPAPAPTSQIHVGDRVRVVNAVTYTGQRFKTWYDTYTVMELKGNRAVIGVNGQVTAAINVANIRRA